MQGIKGFVRREYSSGLGQNFFLLSSKSINVGSEAKRNIYIFFLFSLKIAPYHC